MVFCLETDCTKRNIFATIIMSARKLFNYFTISLVEFYTFEIIASNKLYFIDVVLIERAGNKTTVRKIYIRV